MPTDPLTTATDKISELVSRKTKPLSTLEACFIVCDSLSESDAKAILHRLMQQRHLCQLDGDLAQFLAQRLSVEVQWSHKPLNDFISGTGEWIEGRGS